MFNLLGKSGVKQEVKKEEVKQEEVKQENNQEIKPINSKNISHSAVLKLLTTNSSNYIIIDVRDPNVDFVGGHITKSVNISSAKFYDSLPEIFSKYNNKDEFMLMCMYGAHRSIECMKFYKKAINEIIKNYNKETGKSFYYNNNKNKIDIECNELMYQNLCKQKLYTIFEGFFGFLNNPKVNKDNKNIIVDFDMDQWQELTVLNVTKLYHKQEFFASETVQAEPVKRHPKQNSLI
eukprot:172708_1